MKKNDYAVIPFNSKPVKDKILVSSQLGHWALLTGKEFRELGTFRLDTDSALFRKLYENGLVVDAVNISKVLDDFRKMNVNLFRDTSLHIAVITTRCNLECRYCQAKAKEEDMGYDVATQILKYIFGVTNPSVTLEFQGGEPLLNWKILAFLVRHVNKINKDKDLKIALVSNLTLLDKKKMKFLAKHGVELCGSLDGPKKIHDANRRFKSGKGTYDIVIKKIKAYEREFGRRISLLPTITRNSLPHYKQIIDEYVRLGQRVISLRPMNMMGSACFNWDKLGYSAEEFLKFYRNSLDYIMHLNKKGVLIKERTASFILEKIINHNDPGFVEMMNPCGAGRASIVYMPDGSCYPCDEARMVNDDMFKLGNILNENYEDLMKKDKLLQLQQSSLVNLWDYTSVFAPWLGTCPVVNYATQKNVVSKIHCSLMHKVYKGQFTYIFEKFIEDQDYKRIFYTWIGGKSEEK